VAEEGMDHPPPNTISNKFKAEEGMDSVKDLSKNLIRDTDAIKGTTTSRLQERRIWKREPNSRYIA
jgi:hypothetical protein